MRDPLATKFLDLLEAERAHPSPPPPPLSNEAEVFIAQCVAAAELEINAPTIN
jgi:hypothetical protein